MVLDVSRVTFVSGVPKQPHLSSGKLLRILARVLKIGAAWIFLFAFAACATQISPSYDAVTLQALSDLNVKTETLFASVSKGSEASDFAKYSQSYDEILGGFAAARLTLIARGVPTPSPLAQKLITSLPGCSADPTPCIAPTTAHLDTILQTITAMRDKHRKVGVSVGMVGPDGIWRQAYELDMRAVLDFESELKR